MDQFSITALADLLKQNDPTRDSDSDDDMKPTGGLTRMGPGDVGPKDSGSSSKGSQHKVAVKKNTKDIWDDEEVPAGAEFDDIHDPRQQPEYDIIYKQAITTEDMFLQLGNKNPTTASCENMVVKVKLPDCKLADVKLDVKETFLDCRTPKYKLGLYLPHPVESKSAKAQWDTDSQTLSVTLRVNRPYDFMNE